MKYDISRRGALKAGGALVAASAIAPQLLQAQPSRGGDLQDSFNLSYMFITHDLATVRAIADEVVVMKNGEVIEQGLKDDMFQPPHHPYTELLLSSVPEMDTTWLDTLLESRKVDKTV